MENCVLCWITPKIAQSCLEAKYNLDQILTPCVTGSVQTNGHNSCQNAPNVKLRVNNDPEQYI